MNDREKLIELLEEVPHAQRLCPDMYVDKLIENGVTVLKWISVKERLPEQERTVLVIDRVTGEVTTAYLNVFGSFVFKDGRGHGASHWMLLPNPPKEGL